MADQKETKIPVFSVWKNNTILKNIFLVNAPPPLNQTQTHQEVTENGKTHQEFEETLVVGRHPDCDIRLEHPSISRFHLRIHSKPSSLHLSLTDLSSVHGTWISGKRIQPNVRTRLLESDTLKIGWSSRVYKLHWIPLSQAYDMEHPFVPPLDPPEDEEEEIIKDQNALEIRYEDMQVLDSVSKSSVLGDVNELVMEKVAPEADLSQQESPLVSRIKDLDLNLKSEGLGVSFPDNISDGFVQEEIPPAPPMQNENSEIVDSDDGQSVDSVLEGLVPLFLGENWEWIGQEENHLISPAKDYDPLPCNDEINRFVGPVLEGSDTLFPDENSELFAKEIIPSAPPMPEDSIIADGANGSKFLAETIEGVENQSPLQHDAQDGDWNFWYGSLLKGSSPAKQALNSREDHENENQYPEHELLPNVLQEREPLEFVDVSRNLIGEDHKEGRLWSFWSGNMGVESVCSSLSDAEAFSESDSKSMRNGYQSLQPFGSFRKQLSSPLMTPEQKSARSIWSRRGKQESAPQILTNRSEAKKNKSDQENVKQDPISRALFHQADDEEEEKEIFTPDKENFTPSTHKSMRKLAVLNEIKLSISGKQQSDPEILTSRTRRKKNKADQENVKQDQISKALFHEMDSPEEEIFTPDKENFTPGTHKSMRKLAVLNEVKHSNSGKSSLFQMLGSPDMYYEDSMSPTSDKENYSPKVLQEQKIAKLSSVKQVKPARQKESKGERVPFQLLLADSAQKSDTSILDAAMRGGNSVSCPKAMSKAKCSGERTQKWNMIVDTTTLLNKESRKALQLLEGLKGTQLVIPRIVIRELDCLKRQTSFFRRNFEVLSALEWLQDCMLKTHSWIHVQSSIEEGRPVAPTPPASPVSQFSCGTANSVPFSGFGSQPELLSPTTEDHVLEYALCFSKAQNDGQLVLLSNDVTLKIKAMAEGLLCEEAEEFRESLVNPFSERFLWADSSPRGQTWSCSDDIVLREKFYPSSLKMTPKAAENAKGLKLILVHNSQYFERMTAIH